MEFIIMLTIPLIIYISKIIKFATHMWQQNVYTYGRYLRWMKRNITKVFNKKDILNIILIELAILLKLEVKLTGTILIAIYILRLFFYTEKKAKKPLVYTDRIKRLTLITYTLVIAYIAASILLLNNLEATLLSLVSLPALSFILVFLATLIAYPIERYVKWWYFNDARKKIRKMSQVGVIGITGSYGKTSSKNILDTILNSKYYALPTPKSFNTPMGLTITIRNSLKPIHDYFIAEMGAYKIGEIQELCDFVKPKYGIITNIGEAHLETFGGRKNIQKGKMELVESLPSDGVAVLNMDDEWTRSYNIKNNCQVLTYGVDNKDVDYYGFDIKTSNKGTSFKVKVKDDKKTYKFETKLLGKHNVYNILASISLSNKLGITMSELEKAVLYVEPVEHRLELRPNGNITYIDDAYNSNPIGSKMALDVLDTMPGKKIIITPGMIELGERQYDANKEFGAHMSTICDHVILVGEKQTKPIQDGLKEENYKKKINVVNDIHDALKIVNTYKGETYVLLENDLPDLFKE